MRKTISDNPVFNDILRIKRVNNITAPRANLSDTDTRQLKVEGRHPMGKDDDMKQADFDNMQDQDNRDQMKEDLTEEIDDYS